MKKIKVMKIILIVVLSIIVIGLALYNYIGIIILKGIVGVENDCKNTLAQGYYYNNIKQDLIASGIDKDRVQEISDNIESQKYLKEAYGDNYEKAMQESSDNKKNQEDLLNSVKQLKWYNVFKIKDVLNLFASVYN